MVEFLNNIPTGWQFVLAVLAAAIPAFVAVLAYVKTPKRDVGSVANDVVMAADKAMDMQEESYERKVDDLEERVSRLEDLLVEKDAKIVLLEKEIKNLLRWIDVLLEQMKGKGIVPIYLNEIEFLDGGSPHEDHS